MTGPRRTPEGRHTSGADSDADLDREASGAETGADAGRPVDEDAPSSPPSAKVQRHAPGSRNAPAGTGAGSGTGTSTETELASALETARHERDEYLDMVRRVQADFENYKKRMVRQQTDLLERAAEGLVVRLLPVLDAFDLARAHLEAEGSPEGKALLQAAGLLWETLAKEGLERVEADGVAFDPTTHEAVEHLPADSGAEGEGDSAVDEPVVTDVLRSGYRYKGRVVRPAMVRVRG